MISNRVYPGKLTADYNICIICMDENKEVCSHHCNICNKDSWKACNECMIKLNKCPICRTQFNPIDPVIPLNQIIINININDNMVNNIHNPINDQYKIFVRKLILKFCLTIILGTYLGKIIMFTFCSCICNNGECDKYGCEPYIKKSYWKKILGWETVIGGLILIVGKIWICKIREQ